MKKPSTPLPPKVIDEMMSLGFCGRALSWLYASAFLTPQADVFATAGHVSLTTVNAPYGCIKALWKRQPGKARVESAKDVGLH